MNAHVFTVYAGVQFYFLYIQWLNLYNELYRLIENDTTMKFGSMNNTNSKCTIQFVRHNKMTIGIYIFTIKANSACST